MAEYDYEELVNILGKIHSEPAYSNIKKYIYSHKSKFSPDQIKTLQEMIRLRNSYFNPSRCNQIKEIRAYFQDSNGHEFSFPYSDGKAYSICQEAREAGIPLPDYLNRLFAQTPGFVGWTIDTSAGSNIGLRRATYEERGYPPELPRGIRRGAERAIREYNEEEPEEEPRLPNQPELKIDVADLITKMRVDMEELIQEADRSNEARLKELRERINSLEAQIDATKNEEAPDQSHTIKRVLDSVQYNFVLRNAYKLKLPISYEKIARGQYQVSIRVKGNEQEQNALTFLGEAESIAETVKTYQRKRHLDGYDEILRALCKNYEKATNRPCGLSRTGALSTLADRLAEYAASQGKDWQELYTSGDMPGIDSIDLFVNKNEPIYTAERADAAFDNVIRLLRGSILTEEREDEYNPKIDDCSPEIIMSYILDYDAAALYKYKHAKFQVPEIEKMLISAINGLKECGYYPNRLEAARNSASQDLRALGTTYQEELDSKVADLEERYPDYNTYDDEE